MAVQACQKNFPAELSVTETFDFVVVGGGSARGTVAGRLSEDDPEQIGRRCRTPAARTTIG